MRRLFGTSPSLDEQDQMVIEQMRSLGWDMTQERLVENFLYFPTRGGLKKPAQRLPPRGYEIQVMPGADGKNWLAQANRRQVVTIEMV